MIKNSSQSPLKGHGKECYAFSRCPSSRERDKFFYVDASMKRWRKLICVTLKRVFDVIKLKNPRCTTTDSLSVSIQHHGFLSFITLSSRWILHLKVAATNHLPLCEARMESNPDPRIVSRALSHSTPSKQDCVVSLFSRSFSRSWSSLLHEPVSRMLKIVVHIGFLIFNTHSREWLCPLRDCCVASDRLLSRAIENHENPTRFGVFVSCWLHVERALRSSVDDIESDERSKVTILRNNCRDMNIGNHFV